MSLRKTDELVSLESLSRCNLVYMYSVSKSEKVAERIRKQYLRELQVYCHVHVILFKKLVNNFVVECNNVI